MKAFEAPGADPARERLAGWVPGQAPARRFPLLWRWFLLAGIGVGSLGLILGGALELLIARHAHPPRVLSPDTPATVFTKYTDVVISSADRVTLAGWWIPGRDGAPVLILCHDRGESRASLLGLAAILSEAGYHVLLFDFRGHGRSGGTSSFGTLEKRDLLGAIEWVHQVRGADSERIGVMGVGMGAHAAVLAASERSQVRALALDSPYMNVVTEFAATSFKEGLRSSWLIRASCLLYDLSYQVDSEQESAGVRVRQLADRDLLFLAPRERDPLVESARRMYDLVPDSKGHDRNLLVLPATRTTPLYGEDRTKYDARILRFFRSYLPPARVQPGRPAARRTRALH